jgi:hypothetical protein
MTDIAQSAPPFAAEPPAARADESPLEAGLTPVDPGYAAVLRIVTLLNGVPLAIGATAVDQLAIRSAGGPLWLLTVAAWLVLAIVAVMLPSRRYARIGYALGADELRVARGFLFRVDTIVPFVRVQHIDVGQGPVERRYGLSHLVVHTSGTHNSMVTLPGLPSAEAAAMRDAIRQHIRTDFA